MVVASLFLFVALVPYPIVGEYWGIFWYLIAWPFSGLLKPLWAFSDIIYVLVTTVLAASVWALVIYVCVRGSLRYINEP